MMIFVGSRVHHRIPCTECGHRAYKIVINPPGYPNYVVHSPLDPVPQVYCITKAGTCAD